MAAQSDTSIMALFCDFENIALGARDAKFARFEIHKVLERLLLKGNIVVKKAYCDWDRYKEFKGNMHEAAFELIEIPHVRMSGKIPPIFGWSWMRWTCATPNRTWTPLSSSAATPIFHPW